MSFAEVRRHLCRRRWGTRKLRVLAARYHAGIDDFDTLRNLTNIHLDPLLSTEELRAITTLDYDGLYEGERTAVSERVLHPPFRRWLF